jgi:hypothetical protein
MKKKLFVIGICFFVSFGYSYSQEWEDVSLGFSGYYYNTSNDGAVVGLSGKINYKLNSNTSLGVLVRRGWGFGLFGATEHNAEWNDNINSLSELAFIYKYDLPDVLRGLSVGSGLSYITGKKENKNQYSYLCLPILLNLDIEIIEELSFNMGINSNLNNKIILWGLDLGLSINL